MVLVVLLSLLSAFLFASAATIQQRATRNAAAARPDDLVGREGFAARLPVVVLIKELWHSKLWMLGWITNLFGFLVQAAALHLGSVALVQPLLVTQLLFTLPLVAFWTHRWPLRRDWLAGLLICAGVAVFLTVRGSNTQNGDGDRWRIMLTCAAAAGLTVVLVMVAAAGRTATVHASVISVAAGVCFAVSAVLTKLTATDLVHRGIGATAVDWPGYALALSTLTGLLLEQEAFRAGPLAIAVAGMTITNPIASYAIGVLAFKESPPTSAAGIFAITVSGVLLFLGTAGLSGSSRVHQDAADADAASRTA